MDGFMAKAAGFFRKPEVLITLVFALTALLSLGIPRLKVVDDQGSPVRSGGWNRIAADPDEAAITVRSQDIFDLQTLKYIKKICDSIEQLNNTVPGRRLARLLDLTDEESSQVIDAIRSTSPDVQNSPRNLAALLRSEEISEETFGWTKAMALKVAIQSALVPRDRILAACTSPVEEIRSLIQGRYYTRSGTTLESKSLIKGETPTVDSICGLKNRVLSWGENVGTLVSKDLSATTITIRFRTRDQETRTLVYSGLGNILRDPPEGLKVTLSGVGGSIDFWALGFLLGSVPAVFLIFRLLPWRAAILPLAATVIAWVWTWGSMGFLGVPLTALGSQVPVLLYAVVPVFCFHRISAFSMERILAPDPGIPVAILGLSASLGLGFLVFVGSGPLKDFGIFSVIGVLVGAGVSEFFLPAVMTTVPFKESPWRLTDSWMSRSGPVLAALAVVGAVSIVALALAVCNIDQTRTMTVTLDSDTRDPATRKGEPDVWVNAATPSVLNKIDRFSTDLAARFPGVQSVHSYADIVKSLNRVLDGGAPESWTVPDVPGLPVGDLLTPRQDKLLIKMTLSASLSQDEPAVSRFVLAYFDQAFLDDNHLQVQVGGEAVDRFSTAQGLFEGDLWAVSAGLIFLFLGISVSFRSLRTGLTALVPSGLGIMVSFGSLALAGQDLDPETFLVPLICLGTGAELTVRFLIRFHREFLDLGNVSKALNRTVTAQGRPLFQTVLVVGGSFLAAATTFPGTFGFFGPALALSLAIQAAGVLVMVPLLVRPQKKAAVPG